MPTLVTVTLNPAIDESTTVDHVVPEHKLRCQQPAFEPGGGGLNVARVLHAFENDTLALWTSGGTAGTFLGELVNGTGVPSQPIEVSGLTRTNVVVYEESTTLQYRFGMPGPYLTDADQARVLDAVSKLDPAPGYLVLSGSLPPGAPDDFYRTLIRAAPKTSRIIVDTHGAPLKHALEAGVYLVKPNLRELGRLAGRELTDDPAIVEVAKNFIGTHAVEVVVVSLGAGGAVAVTADDAIQIRSPTVPIRSKVGAGDSMVAGLVHGLARDLPLREALKYGVAAGAAAVMTDGSELCRRHDVERLFELM